MSTESNSCVSNIKPPQTNNSKTTSFFEFWPTWLMYTPVVLQWIFLSIRHRSLTLPFIANPKLPLAGMVGVGKSELMSQAKHDCFDVILPWDLYQVDGNNTLEQARIWLDRLPANDIHFPFVCKPDIGCRGSGVKLIHNENQLAQCIDSYPVGSALLAQKLASWQPEVGIFFVRHPNETRGKIVSLTLKSSPTVIGDGHLTLGELVALDERAKSLISVYYPRHKEQWDKIVTKGESVSLVFSASHCRGAVFTDYRAHISEPLTDKINDIMAGLPEFYYGRLDVKFSTLERLKAGEDLQVVEINGASAESIHIWDRNATLSDAIKTLLWQYRTLFKIGHKNRLKGYTTPGVVTFFKHWRKEKQLAKHYPLTD